MARSGERAITTPAPGSEGVLVLQSGGVLVGRITRDGDRYVVVQPNGELRVPVKDVTMVCPSLIEAYQRKREQLTHPTADAHVELAEWCLRHDLMTGAKAELAAVRELDPEHPKLSLLERRLAVVGRATEAGKERGAGGGEDSAYMAAESVEADRQKPPRDKKQQQQAETLPDGALERFTRKVQAVLVNNCTTSGCHQQGGEQQFQLDRALLHGQANRRSTLRNLAATLTLVDRDTPHLSPLLTIPRRAHAGIEQPIVGPREEQQYEQLVEWVALVTETAPPQETKLVENQRSDASPQNAPSGVVPTDFETSVPRIVPRPRVQYGASGKRPGPKDPFDPEIFNGQSQ